MGTQLAAQSDIERGFHFGSEPIAIDRAAIPDPLFNVTDQAGLFTKVLGDLGMIADPDKAGEEILNSMQLLHKTMVEDRLPDDVGVLPFFAVDLPDTEERPLTKAARTFNAQRGHSGEMNVVVYDTVTAEQLNRRSLVGQTAVAGWSARAMLIGEDSKDGLFFTSMWVGDQTQAFMKFRSRYGKTHPHSAVALMNVMDYVVLNAAIREQGISGERDMQMLDRGTATLMPQAGEVDGRVLYAKSFHGHDLKVSTVDGKWNPFHGVRISAGPKKA